RTHIYTPSLHAALPIFQPAGGTERAGAGQVVCRSRRCSTGAADADRSAAGTRSARHTGTAESAHRAAAAGEWRRPDPGAKTGVGDRKSTRLNSSHVKIS